jgi:hypothetical protein
VVVALQTIKLQHVQSPSWECVCIALPSDCISVNYVPNANTSHTVLNAENLGTMRKTVWCSPACVLNIDNSYLAIWKKLRASNVMKRDISLVFVLKNNVPIAKNMVTDLKIATSIFRVKGVDSRTCRNVMDVKKLDIRSVIVHREDAKHVVKLLIDDTNVVQK